MAGNTGEEPDDALSLPQIERSVRGGFREIPRSRLGWWVFLAVAGLAGVMVIALVVFAALTYPRTGDLAILLPNEAPDRLSAWRQMRSEWVAQFTAVAQVWLYGSVVPLLATIVGYVLGDRKGADSN